jgi:hypothetical protein
MYPIAWIRTDFFSTTETESKFFFLSFFPPAVRSDLPDTNQVAVCPFPLPGCCPAGRSGKAHRPPAACRLLPNKLSYFVQATKAVVSNQEKMPYGSTGEQNSNLSTIHKIIYYRCILNSEPWMAFGSDP